MAISPTTYSQSSCKVYLGSSDISDSVVDSMTEAFDSSPYYREVFVTNDSSTETAQDFLHDPSFSDTYGLSPYKSWVFDGTAENNTVGYKYIQMYPYSTPVLQEGQYISFDYYYTGLKSTWLCLALNSSASYEQIGKIRMCTNEVRFYNDYGKLIRIPCIFDNSITSQTNVTLSDLEYISGITTIYLQGNSDTRQLKPNQRLLFGSIGNWTAFKIVSVGVNNFMNTTFYNNDSNKVVEITMEAQYVNEDTDDLINGIADASSFEVIIEQENLNMSVGETISLSASVIKNNNYTYENEVYWSTSDENVATIDSDGMLTTVGIGETTITATMENNSYVYSSIVISVSTSPEEDIRVVFAPYLDGLYSILQGDTQTFTCYLFDNGVQLDNEFEFTLTTDAYSTCYAFSQIDGNSFSIENKRMSEDTIKISCVSGEYSFDANIVLKGAW